MIDLRKSSVSLNGYNGFKDGSHHLTKTVFSYTDRYPEQVRCIENLLSDVGEPKKLLNTGIAFGEEPLTIINSVYKIAQKKGVGISDIIDYHMVDIQDKFQLTREASRFNPAVVEYLKSIANDSSKTFLSTPIEKIVTKFPQKSFDIVLFNNVLQHMDDTDTNSLLGTLKKLMEMVKEKGIICMEPDDVTELAKKCKMEKTDVKFKELIDGVLDNLNKLNFKKILKGVFRRI